jgi:hypothetical protein
MPEENESENDLDFASAFRSRAQEAQPDEADIEVSEADARVHALEQAKTKKLTEDRAEAEAQAKARREAESRASNETEGESTDSIEIQARALQEARERAEAKARQASGKQVLSHAEEQARREAEEIAKLEVEAKAKRDAEAKARAALIAQERALEAARARVEAEAKARREAEEKARAEAEAKARREAEARARREAEEKARVEAEARTRAEAEAEAKARKEEEAKARREAEELTRQEAESEANLEHELEAAGLSSTNLETRTTSATVLFFDVIGYTKQPVNKQVEIKKQFNRLVSDCLKQLGKSERIILDTGDGAAIGFMQHPEDALKVAMQFRDTVSANQHDDYPELKVRIGIHLGPISIVKDMNGQSNMVGDGINDAQRVMSFAGTDQVYISRPYFDFISRLSSEYTSLFHYQGALPDKHGREHPVYKLVATEVPAADGGFLSADIGSLDVSLEPFNLTLPEATVSPASAKSHSGLLQQEDVALMSDIGKITQREETEKPAAANTSYQRREQQEKPASEHEQKKPSAGVTGKSEEEQPKPSLYAVKKLEEAQAKVWADAEKRAKEDYKTRESNKAKAVWETDLPSEPQPAVKKAAPVARVKRKPFPWFKLAAGVLAAVLLILFVAPMMIPTKQYIPGITKMLGGKLKHPVYIERLEGRLLPTPRLDLIDLAIGKDKQIKAKLARMDFSIPALFTVVKSIDSLELEGVEVDAAALQQASELLQQSAADTDFPISRVLLKDGKLKAEGYALSGIGGELNFDQAGKFSRAKFLAEGNKYEWELVAAPLYKTLVSISVHSGGLPLLPAWVFDELTAKGEIAGSELTITELDGHIMGGTLQGNVRLGWRSDWSAQGSLAAKTITMQNMLKVMSGSLDGTARFQIKADSFAHLANAATLDGSFVIKDGVINGIDIAETARLHRAENMPGGRTHFDELSGNLNYDKSIYAFRNLQLGAGVLVAKGKLDYSGEQVEGSVIAELDFHEGIGPVSLKLGGTRDNPTLVAR